MAAAFLTFQTLDSTTGLSDLDLGTVAPGSSADTLLRVGNGSDLYQAMSVTVSAASGDWEQAWLSTDGEVFTERINVGDIPPGGISPTFWLRRVTASTVADGGYYVYLAASPSTWADPVDTSGSDNIPLDTEE